MPVHPQRPHILVVNGRKVREPVFVIAAPGSGGDVVARALKRSAGFHVTIGQRWVLPVVHGFARRPSLSRDRGGAAATVLRDALAQGWQVSPDCCLGCTRQCHEAAGQPGVAPCVNADEVTRYGDASPDLMYCVGSLLDAFPDARVIQVIREGRDAVAGMMSDPSVLAWFRPGFVDIDAEYPHPLLGLEDAADATAWLRLSPAGKCAMRWRGSVRQMARLRARLSTAQLMTIRYEDMVREPRAATTQASQFLQARVCPLDPAQAGEPGSWRRRLTPAQVAEIESVAYGELRRLGYG